MTDSRPPPAPFPIEIEVSQDVAVRLEREATRRGVTVEELVEKALESVP